MVTSRVPVVVADVVGLAIVVLDSSAYDGAIDSTSSFVG